MIDAPLFRAKRPLGILFVAAVVAVSRSQGEDDAPKGGHDLATTAAVFEAHNRAREAAKLPPLSRDKRLDAAAEAHAKDMAGRSEMSHEGSDGSQVADRARRRDYPFRKVAENVAVGQPTAASVVDAWLESKGHRENILGEYDEMGAAIARDENGRPFWCVVFGTPWPEIAANTAREVVVKAINDERKRAKLPALMSDDQLDKVADARATELAKNSGEGLVERATPLQDSLKEAKYKYRSVMELAAGGQPTPDDFVGSIRDEHSGLKALLGAFSEVGVGLARGEGGVPYWDLILAEPRD